MQYSLRIATLLGICLLCSGSPLGATVTWSFTYHYYNDPDQFNVTCGASTDSGQISHLVCEGSWYGAYTEPCYDTPASADLGCTTAKKSFNCPEGGGSAWVSVAGSIQGDTPSTAGVLLSGECEGEEV